jgi:hypothetical protein
MHHQALRQMPLLPCKAPAIPEQVPEAVLCGRASVSAEHLDIRQHLC